MKRSSNFREREVFWFLRGITQPKLVTESGIMVR
jgi:hypothetical protein